MFAIRLVQLIEDHAERLADGLLQKIKNSSRCRELVHRVPADELRRRTHEVYRHLGECLMNRSKAEIEERYIGVGVRRAHQGVPFSDLFWAICLTKDHFWEYLEREGLLEPVELWGEMDLLHSLECFFDSALYFAATGYELAHQDEAVEKEVALHC